MGKTVVRSLKTGKYHRVNPTAGRMLDAVTIAPSVRDAAALIAKEYRQDQFAVKADLVEFCRHLLKRDLIEITPAQSTERLKP
jgi:hypothetical protein